MPLSGRRVLLAEDHALVRAGLRALLEGQMGAVVVAEAADGREAVRLAALHQPDLVLMDIAMSGLNGLDATARISRAQPDVAIIILSMHATEAYVLEALRAGAAGYVLKDSAVAELALAMDSVARGERYLSPAVPRGALDDFLRGGARRDPRTGEPLLSSRQREVLQLIAEGLGTRQIAERLELSVKTVETHRGEIMRRLDIHDVAGLTRQAIRMGLVAPD